MTPQKKILFISYDGMTDPLGQSQVIPYLKGLDTAGYKIFILSCEKKKVFQHNKSFVLEVLKDTNISWIPIKYNKTPPVFSTMLDIFNLKNTAKKIHLQYGIDMVHTRPGIPALVGLWMKKKYEVKFLNDIREFYADSRVEGEMWNIKNPFYNTIFKFFKKQEGEQLSQSDGIVCLTFAAKQIIEELPQYQKRIPLSVIPCSVDLDLFNINKLDQDAIEYFKKFLGILPDDLIISYIGSIGGWYLTAEMMQFCRRISDAIPKAKFLFISPHRHQVIIDAAKTYGLPAHKIITTHAKRKDVPVILSFSKFSVFFIKPCYSKLSSSPTKHGEIMAMGIPVITNSGVGDVKEIVQKYHAGFVIDNFSDAAYDAVIKNITQQQQFDSNAIRQGATEYYDLDTAIKNYASMYQLILEPAY